MDNSLLKRKHCDIDPHPYFFRIKPSNNVYVNLNQLISAKFLQSIAKGFILHSPKIELGNLTHHCKFSSFTIFEYGISLKMEEEASRSWIDLVGFFVPLLL